jgi:hypothetical protein
MDSKETPELNADTQAPPQTQSDAPRLEVYVRAAIGSILAFFIYLVSNGFEADRFLWIALGGGLLLNTLLVVRPTYPWLMVPTGFFYVTLLYWLLRAFFS